MRRYVAVTVQHPRIEYAGLLRLDRINRKTRHLVTLQEGQREAVVEIVLIEKKKGAAPRVVKRLHTFYLKELPARSGERTQISVEGSYDGRHRGRLTLFVEGRLEGEVALSLPRERRRILLPAAAVALLLTVAGLWWLLGGIAESEEESAETITVERGERDEPGEPVDSGAESGDEAGEPVEAITEAVEPITEAVEPRGEATEPSEELGAETAEPSPAEPRPAEGKPPSEREFVVYFEPDETELTESARSELREIARSLQDAPEASVRIVGHTALFGTEEGRVEISRGRAENVERFLRQTGWEREGRATVVWEGSTDPVTRDPDAQGRNRRVEIEIRTVAR
ncbi:MAG: OmpA family protein [Spirochaetaceae bacterium]